MRIMLNLSVFAFAGVIGISTASARPDNDSREHHAVQQHARGNVPEHSMNGDARHLRDDGRGDTDNAKPVLIEYKPERSGKVRDPGFHESNFALPLKAELRTHMEMRTPSDSDSSSDPKPIAAKGTSDQDKGMGKNPFAESKGPPIDLKKDVYMKVHQGEGREDGDGGAKLKNNDMRSDLAMKDKKDKVELKVMPPMGFRPEIARHAKTSDNGDITDEK